MRMRPVPFLFSILTLSFGGISVANDPLDEMYGQAVHSYFRGNSLHAEELLNEVISAGSQDPRAYYFRGLCQSHGGYVGGTADFERAAQLEIEGKKVVNVGKALERIQGAARVEIEKTRVRARLASRARVLEMQRSSYDEMQRSGGAAQGGIVVPPRLDPAPAPNALAPNDPFNQGMTKGDPKVNPNESVTPVPAADAFDPMPAEGVTPAEPMPANDDPFADK